MEKETFVICSLWTSLEQGLKDSKQDLKYEIMKKRNVRVTGRRNDGPIPKCRPSKRVW